MDKSDKRDTMTVGSDAGGSVSEESYIILDSAQRDCDIAQALEGEVSLTLDGSIPFPVDKSFLVDENRRLRDENENLQNQLVDMQFKCMGMMSQIRGLQEKLQEMERQQNDPFLRRIRLAEENKRLGEMNALRTELVEIKKAKRGLSLEAIRLQNECQMSRNEMQSLREENMARRRESDALKREITSFQSETEALRKEKREHSYEIIRLKNERTMLEKSSRSAKHDCKKLISKNTTLEAELKRVKDENEALQRDCAALADQRNNAVQAKEQARLHLLTLIDSQQERIISLESAFAEEGYDLNV